MAKHATRQFLLARIVLGSAAAVLLALVIWVAVVAGGSGGAGEPVMVQPTADLQAAGESLPPTGPPTESVSVLPSATPSVSVSVSASPSPTPSPSISKSPSAAASLSPKPSKSTSRTPSPSPSPSRTTTAPAPDVFTASYVTSAAWREGFIASVNVVNKGTVPREWVVTVTYPANSGVVVFGGWNAAVSTSGNTVTLRGWSLAPGASVAAGFQGSKAASASGKPSGCSVGDGSCRMS